MFIIEFLSNSVSSDTEWFNNKSITTGKGFIIIVRLYNGPKYDLSKVKYFQDDFKGLKFIDTSDIYIYGFSGKNKINTSVWRALSDKLIKTEGEFLTSGRKHPSLINTFISSNKCYINLLDRKLWFIMPLDGIINKGTM